MLRVHGLLQSNIVLRKTKQNKVFCNFQLEIKTGDIDKLPSEKIFFNAFEKEALELQNLKQGQKITVEGLIKNYQSNKYSFLIKKIISPSNYFALEDEYLRNQGYQF